MKASDVFLQCLVEQGVSTIFGVPGEENADIMMSLLDSPIEFITCRHEQTAAFMADMHGRLTGKPGVCLATLGPGATNLLTGVAEANMDHVPLIAVIGQADSDRLHKESHQNMDAVAMYQPVSKWSTTIRDADVIPEIIAKAVKTACRPRPGAVLVELPEDVAKQQTTAKPMKAYYEAVRGTGDVDDMLQAIEQAQKPLLLVGDGAIRAQCAAQIKTFMDKTHIYAATTFMGKGAVDDRHQRSLHCVGLGMKDIAVQAFQNADLVICVGYSLYEWAPQHWRGDNQQRVIHMDYLPAETDQYYDPDLELIGHIGFEFDCLNQRLDSRHVKSNDYFAAIRQAIDDDLQAFEQQDELPLKPQFVLQQLRQQLRDDDILISDVGAHKMWVARQYMTYQPHTCFIYNGFCSMGGAMPGALEAKRLHLHKQVVAICGDGGFMMSIQALATAVRYQIPMIVMVWQDNQYGLIEWKQEMQYGQSSHIDLHNPDLCQVAQSFGANAIAVEGAEQLSLALQQGFAEERKPTVIVVPIDYRENMELTKRLGKIVASG